MSAQKVRVPDRGRFCSRSPDAERSALVRPGIEVIGTAGDPFVAAERISEQVPDVITLDIEMSAHGRLTFLQKIMSQHPIPVVICSESGRGGGAKRLKAIEYGQSRSSPNLRLGSKQFLEESRLVLCEAVKAAASARLRLLRPSRIVEPNLTADAILSPASHAMAETTEKVVPSALRPGERKHSGLARSAPGRRPRYRDRPAYAELFHARICRPLEHPLQHHRQGGGVERHCDPGDAR